MTARRMATPVLALAALLVSVTAVNFALREAGYTTTLRYARMAVEHEATADSWRPMLQALAAWDSRRPIYQAVFFDDHVKFQYPLSSLFLPMAIRSETRTGNTLIEALNRVSLAASVLFTACCAALFVVTWFGAAPDWRDWPLWVGLGTVVVGTALFHPALMSYVLGQIQTFVNAAFAVTLLAWRLNRRVIAGIALGVACLIKPHFALLMLWGGLRRAWSFVVAALSVVVVGTVAAVAIFGLRDNLDYARVASYMAARGEVIYANQSMNGLLNRLVQPPEQRQWDFHAFPPPNAVVRAGTLITAIVLVGAALALPHVLRFAGGSLDLALVGLSVTMASPIAWDHHYGVLLPILILSAAVAFGAPEQSRRKALWLLGAAFVLAGSLWEPLALVEDPPANLVQSYVFAAGAITLWTMYRLGRTTTRAGCPAGE